MVNPSDLPPNRPETVALPDPVYDGIEAAWRDTLAPHANTYMEEFEAAGGIFLSPERQAYWDAILGVEQSNNFRLLFGNSTTDDISPVLRRSEIRDDLMSGLARGYPKLFDACHVAAQKLSEALGYEAQVSRDERRPLTEVEFRDSLLTMWVCEVYMTRALAWFRAKGVTPDGIKLLKR